MNAFLPKTPTTPCLGAGTCAFSIVSRNKARSIWQACLSRPGLEAGHAGALSARETGAGRFWQDAFWQDAFWQVPSGSFTSPGPRRVLCRRLPETAGAAGPALAVRPRPRAFRGFPWLHGAVASMSASCRSVPRSAEEAAEEAWTCAPHAMPCGPAPGDGPGDGGIEACRHLGYAGAGDVPSGWHRSRPFQAPCPKRGASSGAASCSCAPADAFLLRPRGTLPAAGRRHDACLTLTRRTQ